MFNKEKQLDGRYTDWALSLYSRCAIAYTKGHIKMFRQKSICILLMYVQYNRDILAPTVVYSTCYNLRQRQQS